MSCDRIAPELPLYIREELPEEAQASVAEHLGRCEACSEEAAQVAAVMDALGKSHLPPPDLREGVLAAIERERLASLRLHSAVPPPDLKGKVLAAARGSDPLQAARSNRTSNRRRTALLASAAALVFGIVVAAGAMRISDLQERLEVAGQPTNEKDGDPQGPGSGQDGVPKGHKMQTFTLAGDVTATGHLDHYKHDNFRLTLSVEGFDAPPTGHHYAVWLRGPGGDVPVGTFRLIREDNFNIPFAIGVDPVEFPEIVVTIEPNDGDPVLTGETISSVVLNPDQIHHGTYEE